MADNRAILKLSDGTNEIDLLQARDEFKSRGWLHFNWNPQIAQWKGGGTWSQSALSDGRQLRYRAYDNVTETIQVRATEFGQDALIELAEDTIAMIERGADYWAAEWSTEHVYLICRATKETETRYAIVKGGSIPELEDWYSQPFIQQDPTCKATLENINIILERGHWQDTVPGTGNCLEIGMVQEGWDSVYPLSFNGLTSEVDLLNPVAIDDLATGNMTVEAWVYPAGWGESNGGRIADKSGNLTLGWTFGHNNVEGLVAQIYFDVTDAKSTSGPDEWTTTQFNAWHHVAFTFSNATKTIRLWIDGTEVASYPVQQAGANNALVDNARDATIGNIELGSSTWNGQIGWTRISLGAIYTVNFTPPPRCPLPARVVGTQWLGIHEGAGSTIYDLSGNGNNGIASNTSWAIACSSSVIFGNYSETASARIETCNDEVYIANKHNIAQLTHIWVEDGGAFGANLLGSALPYSLLPAVPAINDRVYFGIDSTIPNSGPFCSLVFNLSQAQADVADIVWEYWNGAWVALTVQDNTDDSGDMVGAAFDTAGVGSVHWVQPSDWITTAVNGVTGYWVRAEVQDAGTAPPIQQTSQVYTITWPYIEIQSGKVGGTLPNLIEMYIRNQSDRNLSAAPALYSTRVIVGLRSYSRGSSFSAYCNLSDEQLPGEWFVEAAGGLYTFQNDVQTPTGRKLQCLNAPAGGAMVATCQPFGAESEYVGAFHAFVRGYQYNGASLDVEIQLRGRMGPAAAPTVTLTDWVPFVNLTDWETIDLENIAIPFIGDLRPEELSAAGGAFTIEIWMRGNGATDSDLYEFIIIPVDEWAIDTYDAQITLLVTIGIGSRRGLSYYLDIDSVTKPKSNIRSVLKDLFDGAATGYRIIANGPAIAQANARQRYWILQMDTSTGGSEIGSRPEVGCSIQMFNVQRYLGARGTR